MKKRYVLLIAVMVLLTGCLLQRASVGPHVQDRYELGEHLDIEMAGHAKYRVQPGMIYSQAKECVYGGQWELDSIPHPEIRRLRSSTPFGSHVSLGLKLQYVEDSEVEDAEVLDVYIMIQEHVSAGHYRVVEGRNRTFTFHGGRRLLHEIWVTDGRAEGKAITYYPNGATRYEWNYSSGQLHGTAKEYDQEGNLRGEWPYVFGELNGIANVYYPNGALYMTIALRNGRRSGPTTEFDVSGNTVSEVIYAYDAKEKKEVIVDPKSPQ